MKNPLLILPLVLFPLMDSAPADTFVLKDGSRLDAKILKETPDSYVLEVNVTKSIKDEKTVKKADVANIIAEKLDETAFEKIKGLVPTPDLLTKEEYAKRITAVNAFVKEYPKSPLLPQAEALLATLNSENAAVAQGGIKLGGTVISPADRSANAYEIDARELEARIRDSIAKGDLLNALRGMTRMENDFISTASRKALLPLKKKVLQSYKAQISEEFAALETNAAARKAGLARMNPDERARTERALAEEAELADRRFKAEQAAEQHWVTTSPNHRASLQAALQQIDGALSEGEGGQEYPLEGGKVYRDLLKLIQTSSDASLINAEFYKASDAFIPEKYLATLKAAAQAKGVTF